LVVDDRRLEPVPLLDEPDVKQILASVLEIDAANIRDDVHLDSLGLDSLTSIEALHALKTEFGLSLPGDFFSTCTTLRMVKSYLSDQRKSFELPAVKVHPPDPVAKITPEDEQPNLGRIALALRLDTIPVSLQESNTNDRLPLFLIHDGSGLVNYYERLSPMNRTVWGIHNPHFLSAQPWDGVVKMAEAYVQYILSITSGPLILGGWSFGGIVAYEIALQLTRRGIGVKGILLIDSPSPVNHIPLSDALIESVINQDARNARSELGGLVKAQFSMNAAMLGKYVPHATASLCPPLVLLRSRDTYNPPGIRNVPQWLSDRSNAKNAVKGWESLAHCSVKIIDIPGHHFQPFQGSHIGEVSRRMAEGCKYLESL